MKKTVFILLLITACSFSQLSAAGSSALKFDFNSAAELEKKWAFKGKQPGVPRTTFKLFSSPTAGDGKVLRMEAKSASGLFVTLIPEKIWKKYPILRWRWRILQEVTFPAHRKEPDDQACVIYFGDGGMLRQFMVGYSWESRTPVGNNATFKYAFGKTNVNRTCMRNKNARKNVWYEEERNVVQDFQRAFKRMPRGECALSLGANSQYSKSHTILEIDFIEFRSEPKKRGGKVK